jgi:hypothetical protein
MSGADDEDELMNIVAAIVELRKQDTEKADAAMNELKGELDSVEYAALLELITFYYDQQKVVSKMTNSLADV